MDYVKCPNCGKQIARKSSSCIYCGVTKSVIEQSIIENEVKAIKETPLKIEGFINNHKFHIIIAEILILVSVIIIYSFRYLPKIIAYSKSERVNNNIKRCENYGGKWNGENFTCETEYGTIEMK